MDPNFATVRAQIVESLTSYKPQRVVIKDKLERLSLPPSLEDTINHIKMLYKSNNYNVNDYMNKVGIPYYLQLQILSDCIKSKRTQSINDINLDFDDFSLDQSKVNYPSNYHQKQRINSMEFF